MGAELLKASKNQLTTVFPIWQESKVSQRQVAEEKPTSPFLSGGFWKRPALRSGVDIGVVGELLESCWRVVGGLLRSHQSSVEVPLTE